MFCASAGFGKTGDVRDCREFLVVSASCVKANIVLSEFHWVASCSQENKERVDHQQAKVAENFSDDTECSLYHIEWWESRAE